MAFMARFWPRPEAQLPSPLGSVRLPSCDDFLCWLWLVDWLLLPQLTTAAGAWWQQWELTLVIFCWKDGGGRVSGSQKAGGAKGVGGWEAEATARAMQQGHLANTNHSHRGVARAVSLPPSRGRNDSGPSVLVPEAALGARR